MTGVAYQIKRFFKKQELEPIHAFKQFNYLNLLTPNDLTDLLQFIEKNRFLSLTPPIADKKTLLIAHPLNRHFVSKFLNLNPACLMVYQTEKNGGGELKISGNYSSPYFQVNGSLKRLALKPSSFELAFVPMATCFREEIIPHFSKIAQSIQNGGRLVLSVIHPLLEMLLYNQNPAETARTQSSLQNYLSALRENHLYLENLTEGVVDVDSKPYFVTSEGSGHFEEFKGIPLVLFLRLVKFQKIDAPLVSQQSDFLNRGA